MDDTNFHDAVKKVLNDDIPYYAQIGEKPATAPPIEMRAGPSGKTKSMQEDSPREDISRVSSATLPISPEATPPSSAGSKKSQKSEKKVCVTLNICPLDYGSKMTFPVNIFLILCKIQTFEVFLFSYSENQHALNLDGLIK